MSTIRGQEPLIPDDANQVPKEPGASTGANDDGVAGASTQNEGATPQVPTPPLLSAENEEAEEDGETALYRTFTDGVEKLLNENLPKDDEENEEVEDGGPPSTSTPKDKGKDKVREGEGSSSNTSPSETVQGDTGTEPELQEDDSEEEKEETGTDPESQEPEASPEHFTRTRKGILYLAGGFTGLFMAVGAATVAKGAEIAALDANPSSRAANYDEVGIYVSSGAAVPCLAAFIYGGIFVVKDFEEWAVYEVKKWWNSNG